ncbi:hypothetical protein KAJ27_24270 [bacterium]|nr:hypothetical protein [bacterium]
MRILVVSYYFPPMNSVASLRIFSWARVWADAGHRITVLTAPKPLNDDLLSVNTDRIEIIEASGFLLKIFQKLLSVKYSKKHPV